MSEIGSFIIYIIIGGGVGLLFYFLFGKSCLGKIYGSIIVGIVGSILGGYILKNPMIKITDFFNETININFLKEITDFFNGQFRINLFAAVIGSILLIWILNLISTDVKKRT